MEQICPTHLVLTDSKIWNLNMKDIHLLMLLYVIPSSRLQNQAFLVDIYISDSKPRSSCAPSAMTEELEKKKVKQ